MIMKIVTDLDVAVLLVTVYVTVFTLAVEI